MSEKETEVQQEPAPQPQLNLADLTLVLNIIQASTQRGAIRAEELSTVGGLYDRLFKFLEASGAIQQATAPEAPAPSDDAEVPPAV
jgi:hypothetical protein